MRKLFYGLIIFLSYCGVCSAAGTVTQADTVRENSNMGVVVLTCTADASDGTYPTTILSAEKIGEMRGWYLKHVFIDPGATGPTANSDITITMLGADLLQARGTDLIENATTTSSYFGIGHGTAKVAAPVPYISPITVTISNNSVNSAVIVIYLVFERP